MFFGYLPAGYGVSPLLLLPAGLLVSFAVLRIAGKRQPADLAAWGRDRYRKVTKAFERIDEAPGADGLVVFCQGTLAGEWLDGTTFEGIRFVDRFTTRHGLLLDQTIWNDMGEVLRAREAG